MDEQTGGDSSGSNATGSGATGNEPRHEPVTAKRVNADPVNVGTESADPTNTEPAITDAPLKRDRKKLRNSKQAPPPRADAKPEPAREAPAAASVQTPAPTPPAVQAAKGGGPMGPLTPRPVRPPRSLGWLDASSLVAAVILPPVGLVLGVVAMMRGVRVRGWASDIARAAIPVALVMTVVFAVVGGYLWYGEAQQAEQLAQERAEEQAHAELVAASAEFCGILADNPQIYAADDSDYGWPAADTPAGYVPALQEYSQVWAELAEAAPDGIGEDTAAIAERVAGVVEVAAAIRGPNRAGDLLGLHQESDLAIVKSWYIEYCEAPE